MKKSWTNPICDSCWDRTENREPIRAIGLGPERCCLCGEATFGGIFVRKDPELVRFPTYEAGGDFAGPDSTDRDGPVD